MIGISVTDGTVERDRSVHLESLQLYCNIVRLRSFSRGAEERFVSQSAASQVVQQLEAALGVALLDRTRRPFVVTPEGQALYEAARELLSGWEKAKSEVAAAKARVDGTVRVAAIYSVGLHDVSRPMQQFMSLYPAARVQLECLHPHKVVEAVLAGEVDIGIMSYPPSDRALSVVPLRLDPMALVCHPSHRLARRRSVMPGDLNGEAFVAFDPELTIRKAIDRALRQHNVRVNIVMAFDNIETIKQAIMIAAGVSILPHHTVQKESGVRSLAAVPLGIPDFARPVGIIHRRQKPLTPTAARFIEVLKQPGDAPEATGHAIAAASSLASLGRAARQRARGGGRGTLRVARVVAEGERT
jgi:DNA-binding transcriptional LysR family regulator